MIFMKRVVLFFSMLAIMLVSKAQEPLVDIEIAQINATSFTVNFHMSEQCSGYDILSAPEGEMDWQYAVFQFPSLEAAVISWGIHYNEDATYTWTGMQPQTKYVVYIVANQEVLITDTLFTAGLGGSGLSQIEVSVSQITNNSVKTKATPNSQTMLFKDFIIEKDYFDSVPMDTIMAIVEDYPYVQYDEDEWVWLDLDSAMDYYFLAIGLNADSVWGEMAMVEFRTLGQSAIAQIEGENLLQVFPIPAKDILAVQVDGFQRLMIMDLQGRLVLESDKTQVEISSLPTGTYLLQVLTQDGRYIKKLPVD